MKEEKIQMNEINFSVIIPTFNRSDLLDRLLASLYKARENYKYGKAEFIVIDSSKGEELSRIKQSCEKYDAVFLEGTDSVRQKRNFGIKSSKYDYIIFEDSDVEVDEELFNAHAKTYIDEYDNPKNAGSFGLTRFVGKDNFVWKIVQYTTLTDSFSFAEKWPYQLWTIGNNVSFKKSILEEVGLFEEAFPFKLGADDLDLSYRITHKSYQIKSQPNAIAYHSKDTWKKWHNVQERSKRWGRMEYYISQRHPEIFINRFPKTEFVSIIIGFLFGLAALVTLSLIPLLTFGIWFVLTFLCTYFFQVKETKQYNPIKFIFAKILECEYYFGHIFEALKNKSLNGIYKQMSFSPPQTRMILSKENRRLSMLIINLLISIVIMIILI